MLHQLLNTGGLISNMAGVVLLFFYGFPQPTHDEEVTVTVEPHKQVAEGRIAADVMQDTRKRKKFYLSMSVIALLMMVSGFGVQLLALSVMDLIPNVCRLTLCVVRVRGDLILHLHSRLHISEEPSCIGYVT